jgi:uncharacterized FAD-dependent dehydrogenase
MTLSPDAAARSLPRGLAAIVEALELRQATLVSVADTVLTAPENRASAIRISSSSLLNAPGECAQRSRLV